MNESEFWSKLPKNSIQINKIPINQTKFCIKTIRHSTNPTKSFFSLSHYQLLIVHGRYSNTCLLAFSQSIKYLDAVLEYSIKNTHASLQQGSSNRNTSRITKQCPQVHFLRAFLCLPSLALKMVGSKTLMGPLFHNDVDTLSVSPSSTVDGSR